eukprot:jgi/Galph1/2977/GphlegSOOS_G1642.1
MKINPLLRRDGTPERIEGEAFLWDCNFVRFQYTLKDDNGFIIHEFFGFGQLYISIYRLVFIWKPPCSPLHKAIELELNSLFEEQIQQALFGPPFFRAKVLEDNIEDNQSFIGNLEFSCFQSQDEGKTYQVILYLIELARACPW